jgi:hypothetical protein
MSRKEHEMARYLLNEDAKVAHDNEHVDERCNRDQIENRREADIVPDGFAYCEHCNELVEPEEPAEAIGVAKRYWRPTSKALGQEPIAGIPFEEMTDAEFRQRVTNYAEMYGHNYRALRRSGLNGLFEFVDREE